MKMNSMKTSSGSTEQALAPLGGMPFRCDARGCPCHTAADEGIAAESCGACANCRVMGEYSCGDTPLHACFRDADFGVPLRPRRAAATAAPAGAATAGAIPPPTITTFARWQLPPGVLVGLGTQSNNLMDTNMWGDTPLHVAADTDRADELLEAYAPFALRAGQLRDARNSSGLNPLDVAVRSGNSSAVTALLNNVRDGGDETASDFEDTMSLLLAPVVLQDGGAAGWPSVTRFFERLPTSSQRASGTEHASTTFAAAAAAPLPWTADESSPVGAAVRAHLRSKGRATGLLRALFYGMYALDYFNILSLAALMALPDVLRAMLRFPEAPGVGPDSLDEGQSRALRAQEDKIAVQRFRVKRASEVAADAAANLERFSRRLARLQQQGEVLPEQLEQKMRSLNVAADSAARLQEADEEVLRDETRSRYALRAQHAPPLHLVAIAGYVSQPDLKDWSEPQAVAARARSVECARALLEGGATIDSPDQLGRTPLHWSSRAGNLPLSRVLLCVNSLITIAEDDRSPLHEAAASGNYALLGLLLTHLQDSRVGAGGVCEGLEAQDTLRRSPLRIAAAQGDADSVSVALCAAAHASNSCADWSQHKECLRNVLMDKAARTPPLCAAARAGSAAAVSTMLAMCPDGAHRELIGRCNFHGFDALFIAARHGHEEVVAEILKWRDPEDGLPLALHAWRQREGGASRSQCSPLCAAIKRRAGAACVPLLLRAGFALTDVCAESPDAPEHSPLWHCRGRRQTAWVAEAAVTASESFIRDMGAHYLRLLKRAGTTVKAAEAAFSTQCGEHQRGALEAWRSAAAAARATAAEGSQPCAKRTRSDEPPESISAAEPIRQLLARPRRLFSEASARRAELSEAWAGLAESIRDLVAARDAIVRISALRIAALDRAMDVDMAATATCSVAMADLAAAAEALDTDDVWDAQAEAADEDLDERDPQSADFFDSDDEVERWDDLSMAADEWDDLWPTFPLRRPLHSAIEWLAGEAGAAPAEAESVHGFAEGPAPAVAKRDVGMALAQRLGPPPAGPASPSAAPEDSRGDLIARIASRVMGAVADAATDDGSLAVCREALRACLESRAASPFFFL